MLGAIKSILKITEWVTDRYDDIQQWYREWRKKRIARKVRKAVDSLDTITVDELVRNIKAKRRDRHDKS